MSALSARRNRVLGSFLNVRDTELLWHEISASVAVGKNYYCRSPLGELNGTVGKYSCGHSPRFASGTFNL
jgi:hypothetical protein